MGTKIKLHARVTKEIEITREQAERLVNHMCGCLENNDINDIRKRFLDGIESGNYEYGYIPLEWLLEDLEDDDAGVLSFENGEDLFNQIERSNITFKDIDL